MKRRIKVLDNLSFENEIDLAIIFITIEGIQHSIGGVASYTRNYINFLIRNMQKFKDKGINLSVYAAEPGLLSCMPTYNEKEYEEIIGAIRQTGGDFYKLINDSEGNDWIGNKKNWSLLSASAATVIMNVASKHQCCLAFFGCSCLAMTQVYVHKQLRTIQSDIKTIYITHDSAFSTFYKEKDEDILSMDYLCSLWTKFTQNAKIGYISEYMKDMFKKNYCVDDKSFVNTKSGICLNDVKFKGMQEKEIIDLLQKHNIPLDKKIVFSWGRATVYKRMDLVFDVGNILDENFYPVVITGKTYPELIEYIEKNNYRGKIVENCETFELISALLQWKNSCVVCFLSENEPGSVTPMEAMYMSGKYEGPIIVTNGTGVYKEIIKDGCNGYIVENKIIEIAEKIKEIEKLSQEEKRKLRKNAYNTIVTDYNIEKNYMLGITESSKLLKKRCGNIEDFL